MSVSCSKVHDVGQHVKPVETKLAPLNENTGPIEATPKTPGEALRKMVLDTDAALAAELEEARQLSELAEQLLHRVDNMEPRQ